MNEKFLERYEKTLSPKQQLKHKIAVLKKYLSNTDYQAIKYAEGVLSEEEYAPVKSKRQEWRNEINELEEEINKLSKTD